MSRRAQSTCFLGALLLGTLGPLFPSQATADAAPEERSRLPGLLQAGAAASKAKNWEACTTAYSRAAEIEEGAITLGELGLCEEAAGRFASAHPHLMRAVAGLAPGAGEPRARYQAALGRVAELVAIVFLTVQPTEARVLVDGRPAGRGDGRHVAVEPGRHVFSARHRGYEDASKPITVNAREMPNLELMLVPKATPVSAPSPVAPVRAGKSEGAARIPWYKPAWSPRGVLVPLAAASVVTATASAVTAAGFEAHFSSLKASLDAQGFQKAECTPGQPSAGSADCQEIYSRRLQRDTALDTWIGTSIAAGAAMGLAGLAVALEPLGPKVTATVSANGCGVVVLGTW